MKPRGETMYQEMIRKAAESRPAQRQGKQSPAATRPKRVQPGIFQRAENRALPDGIKTAVKNLSGFDMDDVSVHYNSDKPARIGALAYTQGTDIHVAPGQERFLPHETWHVVQQKQGRVRPTVQAKGGLSINDDPALEHEADVMGRRILQGKFKGNTIQRIRIPYETLKKIPSAFEDTGAAGNLGIVSTYAGQPATFHHIYPKSKLVTPLRRIEQVFQYFSVGRRNGHTSREVERLRELRNLVTNNGVSAHDYYWNKGTGFAGFRPEFRMDDPHEKSEPVKPRGMGDYFYRAREKRPNDFNKLASEIEGGELKTQSIEACIDIESELRTKDVYETQQNDWHVKEGYKYGGAHRAYRLRP